MTEAKIAADETNERTARWTRALDDVFREALRSTVKHGDQHYLPSGTGPRVYPLWFARDVRHPEETRATYIANAAKQHTDAKSAALGDGTVTWLDILLEEVFEASAEDDPAKLREELVQSASVILKWIEALDRRSPVSSTEEGQ